MSLKPILDNTKTLGESMFLISISEAFEYKSGTKTEKIIGYKYVVVCPEKSYEKIAVKIEGEKKIENLSEEQQVIFDNLVLTPYVMNGKLQISAKADGIKVVKTK